MPGRALRGGDRRAGCPVRLRRWAGQQRDGGRTRAGPAWPARGARASAGARRRSSDDQRLRFLSLTGETPAPHTVITGRPRRRSRLGVRHQVRCRPPSRRVHRALELGLDLRRWQRLAAGRTGRAGGDGAAAAPVPHQPGWPGLLGAVLVAPGQQPDQHRPQVEPCRGERGTRTVPAAPGSAAAEGSRRPPVGPADRSGVARDAQTALKLVEPTHAEERVAHDSIVQRSPITSSVRAIEHT